ncbi:hypothetical protein EV193_103162 [Herbihabitans rhizosphaerae]|uniref:Uncharacterized protein n=1 Tax=Herbihabitans rhizosphaerae TaxID=1872711 RepID=A0A4Q7KV17_9PSEU|nr:hypothetical protein [Herbihabitans rhizosphaerae]RZS40848.1 hypothetical protein EV193_103162 [Herbihabitans rhizosphaerae]
MAGRGLDYRFWLLLTDAVFAVEPQCRRLVTDPAADHPIARRPDAAVAAKAGGAELGEVDLPHKRAALFVYPRTPADLPPISPAARAASRT